MSGDWLPVLLVLGVGLLVGLTVAWRLGKRSRGAQSGRGDDALLLSDLEQRRDDLLARLRRSDNEADRRVLEDQAARVLRDIDDLGGKSHRRTGVASPSGAAAPAATPVAAGRGSSARPMLTGFLGGAAMVALVSVLIFLALRDAEPDRDARPPMPAAASGAEHPAPALPPEVQARLETLRQRVEADPTDLVALKQLALAFLTTDQYVEAFEISKTILEGRPDDPDGLYVQGMVRLTMGQDDVALELLDRVLEQYPNHILALAGRGIVFMRGGDGEAAVLVWERALEAAGGSHPDLEQLLAMARNSDGVGFGGPPPAVSREEPPASVVAPPQAPLGDSFNVGVELAAGLTVPPGATLFVFLRQGEQGPPSAVKRVQDPVFPLLVALGPDDAMLGRPLPGEGTIAVRLDADGSASTRGEGDLAAEIPARVGERVVLVLGER